MTEGSKKKSGRVGFIVSIVLLIILIPIITVNVIFIVKSYTDKDGIPSVLGFKPIIVLSGSMSPAFETGSMIFVRETDTTKLKVGDIICYMSGESAVTHRITEVVNKGGEISYITKGDANNAPDRIPVNPEAVEGVYIKHINKLGSYAMFMQSTTGMILFIVLPLLLYLIFEMTRRSLQAKRDKDQYELLQKELEELRRKE